MLSFYCCVALAINGLYKYYVMIYLDQRNWPEYNAKLVRRGEFYLDLKCVKNWSVETEEDESEKIRCAI